MMQKTIGLFVLVIAFVFTGCKKEKSTDPAYYCKNICYVCYDAYNPARNHSYCNTDYSQELFQLRLSDDSIMGYICKEIEPTIFHEVSGNDINGQIDSQQANRLICYNKDGFNPHYFNYPAFYASYVERNARCTKCYDSIAERYLAIYLDTLSSRIGGFSNCPECLNQTFCRDTAMPYAVAKTNALGMHCGITNGPLVAMPSYMSQYVRRKQFESVCDTCAFHTQEEKDDLIALNSWLDFNRRAQEGIDEAVIFRECP